MCPKEWYINIATAGCSFCIGHYTVWFWIEARLLSQYSPVPGSKFKALRLTTLQGMKLNTSKYMQMNVNNI